MNKKQNNGQLSNEQLRTRAETKLASITQTDSDYGSQPTDELLHELRVHQIELEMQNEELRRVQFALEESRDRYIDLYEFAPIGYLTLTSEGSIAEINLTGAALLGVERVQLINHHFSRYITPEYQPHWYRHFLTVKQQIGRQQYELTLRRADGTTFHAHLDCLTIKTADERLMLRITLTDVTKFKLIEQQLRIAATVFESQQGITVTDVNGIIIGVNHAFTKITGYTAEEVIGKNPSMLQSDRHDANFYAAIWESIRQTGGWKGEIWNQRKNGEVYPEHIIITAVKDQDNIVTHYVATFDDITLTKLAADEVERLAFYDPLTDLPNRRQLLNRLHQALASSTRHNRAGAVLFIDLDNFKALNDIFGHHRGDLLLQQVAQRLMVCVREDDTVARLGGDEFVVILEDLSEDIETAAAEARTACVKILTTLNQPYQLDGREYCSSSSIGVVLFRGHRNSVDELLKRADIAMYQAKMAGRNTLRFFDPEMQTAVTARVALEAELHQALSEKQFTFYFQLQVNHTGNVIGAEMLIRWQHPKRGLISPLDFIPLAEEIGLILPVGHLALKVACEQLKKWEAHSLTQHLQLAVNVSAYQFHQPDFVEQIAALIKETAINPSKLKLELTETVVLSNINNTIFKMNALKELGVGFSMDDFGTGYSSLSYLTKLPFNQLKIDQSFVRNIGVKLTDTVIVQTIIGMTNNLGMEVIAEGVETETQRAFLEQHGCRLYQGYLFSKPVTLAEFELLLRCVHHTVVFERKKDD